MAHRLEYKCIIRSMWRVVKLTLFKSQDLGRVLRIYNMNIKKKGNLWDHFKNTWILRVKLIALYNLWHIELDLIGRRLLQIQEEVWCFLSIKYLVGLWVLSHFGVSVCLKFFWSNYGLIVMTNRACYEISAWSWQLLFPNKLL